MLEAPPKPPTPAVEVEETALPVTPSAASCAVAKDQGMSIDKIAAEINLELDSRTSSKAAAKAKTKD